MQTRSGVEVTAYDIRGCCRRAMRRVRTIQTGPIKEAAAAAAAASLLHCQFTTIHFKDKSFIAGEKAHCDSCHIIPRVISFIISYSFCPQAAKIQDIAE